MAAPLYVDLSAVTDAGASLGRIAQSLSDTVLAARAPLSAVAPAGADEVSGAVAAVFGHAGGTFGAQASRAAASVGGFGANLHGAATAYSGAEAAAAINLTQISEGLWFAWEFAPYLLALAPLLLPLLIGVLVTTLLPAAAFLLLIGFLELLTHL